MMKLSQEELSKLLDVKARVFNLLEGKTFDELVEIFEELDIKDVDPYILTLVMNKMEKVDCDRFIAWADEY